jgi:hypothetical protein
MSILRRDTAVIPSEYGEDLGRRVVQTGRDQSCIPQVPLALELFERCSAGRVLAVRGA